MMKLTIEMVAPGCEQRLLNCVAQVEIVNTRKGPVERRVYSVEAFYRRSDGEIRIRRFTVSHNRQHGMWVLVQKVAKRVQELEDKEEREEIEGYMNILKQELDE